jgi:hypothetical protein
MTRTRIFSTIGLAGFMGAALSCYTGAPVPPHQFESDTTGHDFTWQLDVLGDGNASFLSDAAILHDTLAYAVGEINVRDTSGAWRNPPYNFAQWNGTRWEVSTTADSGSAYGPAWCVMAFAPDDIWVGSRSPGHWDGRQWTFHGSSRGFTARTGLWIRKMWGSSSRDLYAVGDGGLIWHYNGTLWKELASGTTLDFRDVSGAWNLQTGSWEILSVASKYGVNDSRKIVMLAGETVTPLLDNYVLASLQGIFGVPNRYYVVVGNGVYEKKVIEEPVWRNGLLDITSHHINAARGLGVNDVFAAGEGGEVLHYNGNTWHSFINQTRVNATYNTVAVKGDLVIAAGTNGLRGIITRGRRVR